MRYHGVINLKRNKYLPMENHYTLEKNQASKNQNQIKKATIQNILSFSKSFNSRPSKKISKNIEWQLN